MDLELTIMNIINFSGDARSLCMEAIEYAKSGEIDKSRDYIDKANSKLAQAHRSQTMLIQEEAKGEGNPVSLLMVHAQDHLMNAITVKDMATEFIDLYILIRGIKGVEING
jgi:PTS system cellobiose-specific IIA component